METRAPPRKVLILGTGHAQADAILYCRDRGWVVHGVAYRREGRGIAGLDAFETLDVRDPAGITEYARREGMDLVYSVGSDVAMPTVAHVSRRLGLPSFVDEDTAVLLNNKGALREFLARHGVSPVPFRTGAALEDLRDWNCYPAMLKPLDSQGQRGVTSVADWNEVREKFDWTRSFSFTGRVIVEKYLRGPEFSCNVLVSRGELAYAFLSDRESLPRWPGGIIRSHHVPSRLPDSAGAAARALLSQALRALGIRNGPVYAQMKYDPETGSVTVIEMTARLDGCHLWRLLRFAHGVDLLDLTFRCLLDPDTPLPPPRPAPARDWTLEFLHQAPHTAFRTPGRDPAALHEEFYYEDGELVRPVNTLMETVGYRIRSSERPAAPSDRGGRKDERAA